MKTPQRLGRPSQSRIRTGVGYDWQAQFAFWIAAAVVLFSLGIATFVQLNGGHRIGLALMALAILCLAIALAVRRASGTR